MTGQHPTWVVTRRTAVAHRVRLVTALALLATMPACFSWHPVSPPEARARLDTTWRIRVTEADSMQAVIESPRVEGTALTGYSRETHSNVEIPLDAIRHWELGALNPGKTAAGITGVAIGMYGLFWIVHVFTANKVQHLGPTRH
jgi:hypothetical protein